jgi:hypothetical protein
MQLSLSQFWPSRLLPLPPSLVSGLGFALRYPHSSPLLFTTGKGAGMRGSL